ncbi:MAG: tetratricopeptide repeat protein [Bacteroidales bacterium]|nr:tetratricopeptide repeat protein [Bacteroidales bacterium]
MKTIDFSYFIERYNAGEMDEAEKEWFRKELEGNEKLRREVELRNRTDMILKDRDIMNLRNKLNAIEKQRKKPIPEVKSRKPLNIRYAALIASLIIIGSIALLSRGKPDSDEIISRYYKPYEVATISRSANMAANSDNFRLAVEYYNVSDYRNAAIYFSKVLEDNPGDMHTELLNGISNFETQNYPEASGSFSKVIEDNNNFYIDHAQWYLALCYLKTGETVKAVNQLAKIEASRTIYRKDAKKILSYLK